MIELRRKLRYSVYSVFGGALLVGCGDAAATDRGAGDNTAVTIAVAWPWHARQELRYAEGLQLAVDEINAAGGVKNRPIRLRREDDSASVNQGRLLAERLARDKSVVAVIGHLLAMLKADVLPRIYGSIHRMSESLFPICWVTS